MPLGDSTGPLGAGPLTGRGLGPCADDALVTEIPPAYQNSAEVEKTVLGEDAEQAGNRFTQWNKLLKAVDEANPPTPAEQALMQAGGPFSQARLARVNRYLQAQRPQVKTAAFRDGYIDKQAGGAGLVAGSAATAASLPLLSAIIGLATARKGKRLSGAAHGALLGTGAGAGVGGGAVLGGLGGAGIGAVGGAGIGGLAELLKVLAEKRPEGAPLATGDPRTAKRLAKALVGGAMHGGLAGGAIGTAAGAVGGGVAGSKAAQAISRRLRRLSGVEPWEDDAPDLRAAEKIAKAVSRQQQRFMAMVLEAKKGKKPASKAVAKAAAGISAKDARDFAETKHKGLPEEKQAFSEQHVQGGGRNPTLEMVNGWLDDIRQGKVNFAGYRKRLQQEQARTNSLNAGCIER